MSNSKLLSRRDFLKLTGTTSLGLILSACGLTPKSQTIPTITNTPLLISTITPTLKIPTASATQTLTPTTLPTLSFSPTPRSILPPNRVLTSVSSDLLQYAREDFRDRKTWRHLEIRIPAVIVTGVIKAVYGINTDDHDFTFDLLPDPGQDLRGLGKNIHCEIEPPEQELMDLPREGMHVVLVGAYVWDTHAFWREIHPVWYWAELS